MRKRSVPKLSRGKAYREPQAIFYIYCEGANTEPDYFKALRTIYRNAQIKFEIVSGAGDPKKIGEVAVKRRDELRANKNSRKEKNYFEGRDQIWAVFDKDEHVHYEASKQKCRGSGVGVAYSDPCFEHWLNLHYGDSDRPCDRKTAQRSFEKQCRAYNRKGSKTMDFKSIVQNISAAESRAARQLELRSLEGNPEGNPSTTVFRLTESIKRASDESSPR